MNRMADVAKLFCLKLNEEFSIKGDEDSIYKFTEEGLKWGEVTENDNTSNEVWFNAPAHTLEKLLCGEYVIQPFIPKFGENYYYVTSNGNVCGKANIEELIDLYNINMGNCFKYRDLPSQICNAIITKLYHKYNPKMGADIILSILDGDDEDEV